MVQAQDPSFQVLSFRSQSSGAKPQLKRYQKRKTHAKSRAGCTGCKVKRVKCDEARPSCGRCQRTKSPCIYGSSPESLICTLNAALGTASNDTSRSLTAGGSLSPTGCLGLDLDRDQAASPYGTPRMVLLHHFPFIFGQLSMFDAPNSSPKIISLGLSRPYLLDAVLAVSASHLRHHTDTAATHRVAEHFQQSLALRKFQSALGDPLDAQGSDALLLTGMFLNLLTFTLVEDDDPAKSWVFSDNPDRLNWFSLHLGYKPLLMATRHYHSESTLLKGIFAASDDEHRTYNGGPWPLDRVPVSWLTLCGLDRDKSTPDQPFHEAVRILAELKVLPPRPEFLFLYVGFIGKIDIDVRTLVEAYDCKAMWLLGYWLGLLRRFDMWWLRHRVNRDHRAILIWLDQQGVRQRSGDEGKMWSELMLELEMAPIWIDTDPCVVVEPIPAT